MKVHTKLWIKKSGLLSLVQDAGRMGYQAFGVPKGGALDRRAAKMANWLVGQAEDAPVLEITLRGPVIQFDGSVQLALAGADLSPTLNGSALAMYQTFTVAQGDVLAFGARKSGCRSYLAFGGHLQIGEWLGSQSAFKVGDKVLPKGSEFKKGAILKILPKEVISPKFLPLAAQPFHSRHLTVRVMPGPEFSHFTDKTIDFFTSRAFRLSADCNRMGYRLSESLPGYNQKQELISSGIVPGTIQVLPSGKPIILLADAQTTGGYPRIAVVVDRDLDDLGQLAPGDWVRFSLDHLSV